MVEQVTKWRDSLGALHKTEKLAIFADLRYGTAELISPSIPRDQPLKADLRGKIMPVLEALQENAESRKAMLDFIQILDKEAREDV